MNILKIKDPQGNWVDIPALKGDKGDKGDPGISPTIDSTLSQANQAADAKAVGDKIDEITLTIDETLTQSGQVADAKVTGDTLNTKANQNGYYENLNVGIADQLASKNYIEDNEAYTFRPTGNGAKVGTREFNTIVGGSIVWNQLVQNGNFTDISTWSIVGTGTTYTVENNIATVNHAAATSFIYQPISCITNHKYFITVDVRSDVGTDALFYWDGGSFAKHYVIDSNWRTIAFLYNGVGTGMNLSIRPNVGEGNTSQLKNFMLLDLTQMFGSEIADYIYNLEQTTSGAGVAWFRKYFSEDYYDYNPGELMHVTDLQSHDMVGFNLWDEEWESANINWTTYIFTPSTNGHFASKNYVPVISGATYYCKLNRNSTVLAGYTDDNGNGSRSIIIDAATNKVTIPSDVKYIKFGILNYGNTYNHDICINLSGTRNGEYEPYKKNSYPLDSSLTLRGIPKLVDGKLTFNGDIYKPDGTVERRYGIVTLNGSESWLVNSVNSGLYYITFSTSSGVKSNGKIFSNKFISTSITGSEMTNGQMKIASTNINFKTPYATLEEWKDALALNPVIVIYELATPATEEATPYQSPQIIDPYGTEEYVTTSIVPVGHQTQYPEDLRAKIESLPWDFANLIAPVEVTYIATRNYTAGSLFIINNILYKATANIANGGIITPNTNCIPTTLAEIIAAL